MVDRKSRYKSNSPIKNQDLVIDVKFDISELDLMCSYIVSENKTIHRGNIINMRNLFLMINMDVYKTDNECIKRITFINKGIDARLNHNLTSRKMVLRHIAGGFGNPTDDGFIELSNAEIAWVNSTVSEILKYAIFYNDVDKMFALANKFKATDFINRGEIVQEIEDFITALMVKFRRAKAKNATDIDFSLEDEKCLEALAATHAKLTSPSNKLQFGTQALNLLTGGGIEATRVYTLLGLPGEGKSSTLIDMAIQIKRYNRHYKCADPTKRPCIVVLIMENSVIESVERIFSMCVGNSIVNYTLEDAISLLKNQGNLRLSFDDPIDIYIKFKPNLSEDTSYLYTLVEDLEDEGIETICLIQDYIKRIRSVDGSFGGDLRLQLGAVINEFKTFATIKNIPVITASQLNRTAASNIDEARIKNKADLVRLLGRANVGESNLILENSDWIGLIAPEYDKDGNKYLGIQRVKCRYNIPNDVFTAYLPYVRDTIKLIEDLHLQEPVHKITMREAIDLNTGITGNNATVGKIMEFDDINMSLSGGDMFANSSTFVARQNYMHNLNILPQMCYMSNQSNMNKPELVEMCRII